jgi:aspartyl-tRNA(Asn)/glutamyl-tRNA(Gln) amidotransferase subunit A
MESVISEAKQIQEEYGCFTHLAEKPIKRKDTGKLAGYFISVKDCICVKGVPSRAGSSILEGYSPLFNATVIDKVLDEGGTILGKTSQDEFGFGSFNVNTNLGVPKNPNDKTRCAGGSSGGSCVLTKLAKFKHVSIAESTGGSIVNPACFCGVYGLSPTYGLVSRYGLIDYGNSLDKIGPVANNMEDIAKVLTVISGKDHKDSTSLNLGLKNYEDYLGKDIRNMKVAILKDGLSDDVDLGVRTKLDECISELKSAGVQCDVIEIPISKKYALATYYILAMSESSTNLAKYCGIRYGKHEPLEGNFNDYFSKVRTKHFHPETKRRIILGTFVRMASQRDAYYVKAAKIRTKIVQEYKEILSRYDLILSPTMPSIAPKFEEIESLTPVQNYMMDLFTVGPNLAGLPHLNVPYGTSEGMPVGLMFIADHLKEEKLISIGSFLDRGNHGV